SQPSDVLVVKPGSYTEDVTIGSTLTGLTVNADPATVLNGTLTVSANNVTVDGLTIATFAGTAPSLTASGGKLTLTDATVVSFVGTALSLTAGAENLIQRSTIASTEAAGDTSDGVTQGPAELTVDSSIVFGGAKGAAFRVTTTGGSAAASLKLNHVTTTAPATGKAIVLDGTGGSIPLGTVGNITLAVASSIVHGASSAASDPGLSIVRPANAVTASFVSSDATDFTGADGQHVAGTGNPTPDSDIFGPSKRLKFGSAVIDKGGPVATGESVTDIDGDPRTDGAATDIGADEFFNHAPTLTLAVAPTAAKTGEVVTATGAAKDKEGAADLASYAVSWGDGLKDQSNTPSILHAYAKPGTFTVAMVAVDKSGALSSVASQTVTVTDGTPPDLRVTTPKPNAKVALNPRGKQPLQLNIIGVDADASGIAKIEVALTRVGKPCRQYTGTRFAKRGCGKYAFRKARLNGNGFRLVTKKGLRVPKGTYEVRARATDVKGNKTTTFSKAAKTLVRFRVG
ncbi:MAG: hypothetical protein QOI80_3874, partial [Solirubrobacteraceae bacterium]|nr:hypothetical protein [Solirubrobacteraceae bacterium]